MGDFSRPPWTAQFSARPVGPGLPHVDVGEALSGVHAHPAPVRHELSCVGRHRSRGLALHRNVSRRAVAVLTVGRAAHLGVVLGRPVGAVDDHRGGKMAADALQYHYQPGGGQDGVGAVLAGKFFHGKVGGQLFAAVLRLGIGVDLDHRPLSFRFFGFFAFQLPDEEKRDHPPVPGDALPCRIHEAYVKKMTNKTSQINYHY